jgi:dTDP-4-amino-4,6-dideoxygalactose transaminase
MERLAIHGGTPVMSAAGKGAWPDIRPADRAAVAAVLERGILGGVGAPEMTALEDEWARFVGTRHALLLNSGTAAIHAALHAVGVRPGDEVITTAYTFAGTFQPILQQGAIPVFVDIDPETFNLDVTRIESRITDRTRAILPVHIQGLPADLGPILEIARRHDLKVVEDGCQAHGATYQGRRVGSFGDVGAFSLNSSKILCGGEGGLLVTDDDEVLHRASRLRTFGEDIPELAKLTGWQFRPYTVHSIGWNYRHQEMPAALARAQLQRLPEYIATAQANAAYLSSELARIPGLIPPFVPDDRTSVFYLYRLRFDLERWGLDVDPATVRDLLGKALLAEGVDVSLWHETPVTSFPIFRTKEGLAPGFPWTLVAAQDRVDYRPEDYPVAKRLLETSLCVGSARHPLFVQPREVMEGYVAGFAKVLADPGRLLEAA